jgi:hypothetical protein
MSGYQGKAAWRFIGIAVLAMIVLGIASQVPASVITLQTAGTINTLFATTPTAVGTTNVVLATTPTFSVNVYSQAYTDGSNYVYLYQLENFSQSAHPVEIFTLAPVFGATSNVQMGYLTGDVPSGFLSGGAVVPESTGSISTTGPILSFYYTTRADNELLPGECSAVMFVKSPYRPDQINGSVIDGNTSTNLVVGPVPEPATLALLAVGGVLTMLRRRTA